MSRFVGEAEHTGTWAARVARRTIAAERNADLGRKGRPQTEWACSTGSYSCLVPYSSSSTDRFRPPLRGQRSRPTSPTPRA